MLNRLPKALLREYRTHRMARFTVWVLAYGAVLMSVQQLAGGVSTALWVVCVLAGVVCGVYYLGRLVELIRPWRVSRRLAVTYVFIAVVPIVLIGLVLVPLGIFILGGQFAALLVTSDLRGRLAGLQQVNRVVSHQIRLDTSRNPGEVLDRLQTFYVQELQQHAGDFPGLEVTLWLGPRMRTFREGGTQMQLPVTIPAWFKEEFAGFASDRGRLALRSIERTATSGGNLVVILSQPLTPELLDRAGEGIGPVGVFTQAAQSEAAAASPESYLRLATPQQGFDQSSSISSRRTRPPEPTSWFDFPVLGTASLDAVSWHGETQQKLSALAYVGVSSRVMALERRLLETQVGSSQVYVFLFKLVAVLLLIIEGYALFIGVRLARSITHTVDKLYAATERVKKGDFSYRIRIPSTDQISALGEAFDSMTASVERLLRESEEKLRLQSELEIAREVQAQLFPRAAPEVPGLTLYGVCKAARTVSGDYYDFLRVGEGRVCLVLGDVSGKGISAALLMAAIQSALRAQFYDGLAPAKNSQESPLSTSAVVSRLNVQLYESTPREKYVTFFFAVYDAATRCLTYTNAGHLPPVLLRRGRVERLNTGGTVVGLFSPMNYEQAEIQIQPGDLLLAFTDGITEPENIYGEEFGEDRMLQVVRRAQNDSPQALTEEIYRSVSDWTGSPELQDDMTLLVARASGEPESAVQGRESRV